MLKIVAIFVTALLLSVTTWSQDRGEGQEEEQQQETDAAPEGADGGDADEAEPDLADLDDPSLDDQTYGGDDDEFIPTEEVPVDEPIPFPSDI